MGLLSPFVHKTKTGQKFWLHMKQKGRVRLYFFSKDQAGALYNLPSGYEVVENPRTGLPFLKRKTSAGIFGIFKPKQSKSEEPATQETK